MADMTEERLTALAEVWANAATPPDAVLTPHELRERITKLRLMLYDAEESGGRLYAANTALRSEMFKREARIAILETELAAVRAAAGDLKG